METTFCREGKSLSYAELTQMLGNMIEKNILGELDQEALEKFYLRLFETTYAKIRDYLELKNYKVVNYRQGLLTASQVKLITKPEIWYEALERKNLIDKGKTTDHLRRFIIYTYYKEMRVLLSVLGEK